MVNLRLRHEVRQEDWDDDDWSDDDDDLTKTSTHHPAPTEPREGDSDLYTSLPYSDYKSKYENMPTTPPVGFPGASRGPLESGESRPASRPTGLPGRPSSLMTAVSSSDRSALSDQTGSISSPASTPVASDTRPTSSTASAEGFGRGHEGGLQKQEGHSKSSGIYAAAGIVPVVVIAIIAAAVFFYLRKRKRQRLQSASAQARMQQMKQASTPFVAAHYRNTSVQSQPSEPAPPPSPPPPSSSHSYAAPPPGPPPPVILGPIAPTSNGAYFTGIDTSDVVSVNDRTGLGDPFADGNSLNEEPPPPYRPRSLAPSRDASLRAPSTAGGEQPQTNLLGTQDLRSPFADPQDDDAVSVLSGRTVRRDHDAMSAVSDLSYQDPVMTRPSL